MGWRTYCFAPPPPSNFDRMKKIMICNARISFKSTVRHYKTIKLNKKVRLTNTILIFWRAKRAKFYIAHIAFPYSCPPPPFNSKYGSTPLLAHCLFRVSHSKLKSKFDFNGECILVNYRQAEVPYSKKPISLNNDSWMLYTGFIIRMGFKIYGRGFVVAIYW